MLLKNKPYSSVSEIISSLNLNQSKKLSPDFSKNIFKESNSYKKVILNEIQKKNRLIFVKKYINMDWKKVVISDEKKFNLQSQICFLSNRDMVKNRKGSLIEINLMGRDNGPFNYYL